MYKQYYRVDHLLSMGKILEALWSNREVCNYNDLDHFEEPK